MKVRDFIKLYQNEALLQTLLTRLRAQDSPRIQLKGLMGSADAVYAAALYTSDEKSNHLFVLPDKDEAAFFLQDLQQLLENNKNILYFPYSYKKPYQFLDVENANIVERSETLSRLNTLNDKGLLVVTYPEALSEKVINKRSLLDNTFTVRVGDTLDLNFLAEVLANYDFERTDFAYEAGQYAIRGGIVDIFSYSGELPYRLELFGDEIESIRTFNPETQLSVEPRQHLSIVPNVQTRLLQETRESFLGFLPQNTVLWFKDVVHTIDVIDKYFERATAAFEQIVANSGSDKVAMQPADLFDSGKDFKDALKAKTVVEFGSRFHFKNGEKLTFSMKPQPSFNKDFKLLAATLAQHQSKDFVSVICSDTPKQLERLQTIFEELDKDLKFQPLYLSLRQGFEDENARLVCYTDHQIFDRYHRVKGKDKFSKSKALTLKELKSLQAGDYVTHIDYGVGRFVGLERIDIGGRAQEAVRLLYRDDDYLFVSIHSLHKISKYSGREGTPPQISKLGTGEWEAKKSKVKKKVKDIAKDLIELYAKRKAAHGMAYSKDGFMQIELESSFLYEDTPDQAKATADVKADMEQPHPMDRLVCGDVGFGKTEVAVRAAFKAAADGKQVAVLVPTTILAMQHYKTFKERLNKFPVTVEYVNRFKSDKEIKETLKKVTEGKVDILIGTHRLVSADVKFKDLGLMIIDEEQKFGVKVKEKLKEMRVNVDSLTLTATPIPRTLNFSLLGARDLSIIATPPPNRQPVTTEVHVFDEIFIRDALHYELKRGGQVFFVHNRVGDIEEMANNLLKLVPDARIGVAHGQMDGSRLENVMLKFIEGEYDILVSTNIIESGLDIPNANTIIINRAHMYGMSDLHQMRGRVGRSNKKAYCYLLTPAMSLLSSDARKRLQTLEEFSELGDGFKVAMRDLDIRGAGDLLGSEQSGFITDLGFDAYHKILDEAVQELKETEFADLFKTEISLKPLVRDCVIETDLEILIPEQYVNSISERLSLYSKLDDIKDEQALAEFETMLTDRFGALPPTVQDLIQTVRLRWLAEKIGFEKLVIKETTMRGHILNDETRADYFQSDAFGKLIAYIQMHARTCRLKESGKKVVTTFEQVRNVQQAIDILREVAGEPQPMSV